MKMNSDEQFVVTDDSIIQKLNEAVEESSNNLYQLGAYKLLGVCLYEE